MNVLMVEDDAHDAELLEITLQRANGCTRVDRAQTLAEACRQVNETDYDAVLLDLGLPDSNGLSTVRQLQSANDSVPIVILSGYDDDQLAKQALNVGADDYMVKGDRSSTGILRAIEYAIERHHNAEELRYLAHHDALTGVANRTQFLRELDRLIAAPGQEDQMIGVLMLDLDRFTAINEQFGYEAGDQLLKESTERVRECTKGGDLVARLKADQLAVLVSGITSERAAEQVAESIHRAFRARFEIAGEETSISVSIGIALYPNDAASGETLLAQADSAMHEAKEHGRNRTRFYSKATTQMLLDRRAVRNELNAAIEQRQFELRYRPRYECNRERVHSIAASAYWRHPTKGLVGPDAFYALAEREQMAERIEEFCIEEALDRLCNWAADNERVRFVSLDVSAELFEIPAFPEFIERALLLRSLEPGLLEIGVHEKALSEDPGGAFEKMHKLHDLGVRTAIHCFGTGFASLHYMTKLPLDTLSISRTLVADLNSYGTGAIVHTLAVFAHDLGLTVNAKGVDTREAFVRLHELGCDVFEGEHFCAALDADEMATHL